MNRCLNIVLKLPKKSERCKSLLVEGMSPEAQANIRSMSLSSCAMALRAALEKAGKPVSDIDREKDTRSSLLAEVCSCTVLREIAPNNRRRVSAMCIRSESFVGEAFRKYGDVTVGYLLDAKDDGASEFLDEMRDDRMRGFPADLMAELSVKVVEWVQLHWEDIEFPADRGFYGSDSF